MHGWSLGVCGSEMRLKLTFPSELGDGCVPVTLWGVRCFCCVCALAPPSWMLSSRRGRAEHVSDSYFLCPAKPGTVPGPQQGLEKYLFNRFVDFPSRRLEFCSAEF